jgi:23S rRNA pseudouridine1911/1915/1917 synthase
MAKHADTPEIPEAEPRKLQVEAAAAGRRLDVFLAEKLGLSRAQVRRLLGRGSVAVAGRAARERDKGRTLAAGDQIIVAPYRAAEDQRVTPEPERPLVVLARGPGWLAVDKPAGVAMHPFEEDETGSLLGAVVARHPELQGVGEGGLKSGIVHRLDVDTSGVVLIATEEGTWRRLRQAFQEHRVEKVYRAIVAGRMETAGEADVGVCMARHRPAKVRIVDDAERARARGVWTVQMAWRPLEVRESTSLVEVRPLTGFLHQIRVVLAHAGHPLLGDRTYAPPEIASRASRHMLHATRVAYQEIVAFGDVPDPEFSTAGDEQG